MEINIATNKIVRIGSLNLLPNKLIFANLNLYLMEILFDKRSLTSRNAERVTRWNKLCSIPL